MKKLAKHPVKVKRRKPKPARGPYRKLLSGVVRLIEQARLAAVRSVNVVLTSTYWLVGQRIIEHEQSGTERAAYGQELLKKLAEDLTPQLGRGFSERNLEQMRLFCLGWPYPQTASAKSALWPLFPLPWSHYIRLLSAAQDPSLQGDSTGGRIRERSVHPRVLKSEGRVFGNGTRRRTHPEP
jgi:hypothetical protein